MKTIEIFKSKLLFVAACVIGMTSNVAVADILGSSTDDKMLQYYKTNDKYSCSPEELAGFIEKRRSSLTVKPNIMSASEFIRTEVAKPENQDNCLTLFDNLDVIKDIQKLVKIVQNMSMPSFSTDGMGTAAQAMAMLLFEAAMESVCNALTKEAAEALINEIMSAELGYDMEDMAEFDPKKFAKGVAMDHAGALVESKGVDADWLDPEEHKDLMDGEMGDQKDLLKDSVFKKD